jgi:hypothetical protein
MVVPSIRMFAHAEVAALGTVSFPAPAEKFLVVRADT